MKLINLLLTSIIVLVFSQCDDPKESIAPVEDDSGYLPLIENTKWIYQNKLFSTNDHTTPLTVDTTFQIVKGDTLVEGLLYKKIVTPVGELVIVRKKNGKYYGRNQGLYTGFSKEYLFLDDNATQNSSWKHYKNESTTLTEFKVIGLNMTMSFFGHEYHDVIKLEVNYSHLDGNDFVLDYSTQHYYAKGIGEIYTSYPYPSLMYGDYYRTLLK